MGPDEALGAGKRDPSVCAELPLELVQASIVNTSLSLGSGIELYRSLFDPGADNANGISVARGSETVGPLSVNRSFNEIGESEDQLTPVVAVIHIPSR